MDFQNKLSNIIKKNNSLVCVGLDPDGDNLSGKANQFEFNKWIIEETADIVCAYKPNIAFYEAYGIEGLKSLKKTLEYLKSSFPQIPVVLDAKRADVPNTAKMYAKALYDYWGADAATVYPHLGYDSVEPFLDYADKLTILLLKTSNPNSSEFQDLETDRGKYYLTMADKISKWKNQNFGILVGATYPNELKEVRKIFPDKIFLSPGFGGQGAQIGDAVVAGIDNNGAGILFNASRSIIYSQDPKSEAKKLRNEINKYRKP